MLLASGQFVMTLDSSVMNVSMAVVASDLGTTISGIQTAITLYTLVMATMMITGGKIGTIIGRRRAFGIGLVIYAAGSLTTALAPNLGVLLIGWSLLEGLGASLIMPAIVALVAANFPAERRAAAYGLVAAAGGMAVAAGPLIGGAVTTFSVVALRLRRRGRHRPGHPALPAQDGRRAAGTGEDRLRRVRAVRRRSGLDRLRRAAHERVGLDRRRSPGGPRSSAPHRPSG